MSKNRLYGVRLAEYLLQQKVRAGQKMISNSCEEQKRRDLMLKTVLPPQQLSKLVGG